MKNKKLGLALLAAALVVLIAGGVILYNALSKKVDAEVPDSGTETGAPSGAEDAVPFTVFDADGNAVNLADYLGKCPIVVNIWATWCPPCVEELPYFDDMYSEYGDDVEFFMVDCTDGARETVESVKEFVSQNGFTFPVYYDTEYSASNAYSVYYIPVSIFIGSDGKIVHQQVGGLDKSTLESYVSGLVK